VLALSEARGASWQPAIPFPAIVQTARADSGRLVFRARAQFTDFRVGVLSALAGLLLACGDCVRRCPECGYPFVPIRGQKFCDVSCQQRDADRKRYHTKTDPAFTLKTKGGK
jgi:hypothetical protein